jgi:RimJ/RimL family protein N-acetyltransferase
MIVAETQRLRLRHFVDSDVDAMARVFGDPEVMRFGRSVQTREWVRGWLARCADSYARRDYGLWAAEERQVGEVIGYCGLTYFPDINGRPEIEIGYRLARSFWGRGYATEAARAVRDHAFAALGLRRLIALVDPDNIGSIRVAEKLGMRHEADAMLEGYTHPDRVYAIERHGPPGPTR